MTTFSEAFPSDYLCAADILPAGPDGVELTIKSVDLSKTAKFPDGKPVTKPIIHFDKAKKGLVCNATNAKRIILYYQALTDLEKWAGVKIRLYCELVRNPQEGTKTPAIRVAVPGKKGMSAGGVA